MIHVGLNTNATTAHDRAFFNQRIFDPELIHEVPEQRSGIHA